MSDHAISYTNKSPLVSVIIPVYNRASRIVESVASVRTQTYRPLELIVVDDGSTDETPSVLASLREEIENGDGLVIKIVTQANAGAPAARNHGFRESSGDWILFVDSDDLLLQDKVKLAMQTALESTADIVYSKAQYIDQSGTRLPRFWGRRLSGDWQDHFEFSWQTMCAVYSRRAVEKIGPWNERLIISQDWEYCIRALSSGLAIHYEDRVDALYRCEGDDRIGSGISTRKHHGRETALWAVWNHLDEMGLLNVPLKKRFRSRLLHILLCYLAVGECELANDLVKKMKDSNLVGIFTVCALRHLLPQFVAKFIIDRFDRRIKAQRI